MAHTVTYESFNKICRFCTNSCSDSGELFPLFLHHGNYGRYSMEFKESIPEIISSCIGLNIEPNDGLPINMCNNCLDKLMASNSFRHLCLQSANILQEIKIQHHYEQLEYDSEDNEPLHSLKPPEMVFVETIKNECEINDTELCNMDEIHQDDSDDYNYYAEPESKTNTKQTNKTATKRKSSTSAIIPIVPAKKPATETSIKAISSTNKISTTTTPTTVTTTKSTKIITTTSTVTPPVETKSSVFDTAKSMTKQTGGNTTENQSDDDDDDDDNIDSNQKKNVNATQKEPKKRTKMPKQCTVCGLIVKRLRDHMKIHPEALEFRCQHCNRTYLTQVGLDRHMDTQHTESDGNVSEAIQYNRKGQIRLKKVVKQPHKWKKNIAKAKRSVGEEYISNGILRRAKQLMEPCPVQCKLKCAERISEEERYRIFRHYWNLGDVTLQRKFIVSCMEMISPKYRRPKEGSQRSLNFAYKFHVGNMQKPIRVCKTMFLKTIDVSDMTLRTAYRKYSAEDGQLETDLRGRRPRSQNKHSNYDTEDSLSKI